jgi:hypothetical protein
MAAATPSQIDRLGFDLSPDTEGPATGPSAASEHGYERERA